LAARCEPLEQNVFLVVSLASKTTEEKLMSWDMIEGNWKQLVGNVKEQWGKLTDDDLAQVNGKRDQLEGKIQEKYGYGKDKASAEIDDWIAKHK
jgi:uncharacterized protein YjbJ (UPF0337 family)